MTFAVNQKRAYALDALRGFAVLTMILSGTISYRILPAWMYHAQEPPPTHTYNPTLAGLTWVDLVFPLFLFAMGASIPLALSRRLEKGDSLIEIIFYILKRGFFLGTFAIVRQHFRPDIISQEPTLDKWWIGLWGFLLLFFMFVRLPDSWNKWQRITLNTIAWLAAVILLSQLQYPDGTGFSLNRSDIILVVLTNTAVFGSLIWLFTKSNWWLRVGIMGLLLALRFSSGIDGSWTAQLWSASPAPWIFQFSYLSYLFIVIPGTIAGDLIWQWLKIPDLKVTIEEEEYADLQPKSQYLNSRLQWPKNRFLSISLLLAANCIVLLIGLQNRWVWPTTVVSAVICLAAMFFFTKPSNEIEYLIANLYPWGTYWLFLGLLFEPFQGGIKKDPATLSYYFVTTGMSIFILILFTIFVDIFRQKKWLLPLIENGQNPMIAYVGFANVVWPILTLTGIDAWVIQNATTPLVGFLKGLVYTTLVACIVCLFTRLRLFWRT